MQAACSQLPVSEIGTRVRINEFYSSSDRGIGTVLDGKGFCHAPVRDGAVGRRFLVLRERRSIASGGLIVRHRITPPIPAMLANGSRPPSPCLVWAIVPDPVNPTSALVSATDAPSWEVAVHADRLTY